MLLAHMCRAYAAKCGGTLRVLPPWPWPPMLFLKVARPSIEDCKNGGMRPFWMTILIRGTAVTLAGYCHFFKSQITLRVLSSAFSASVMASSRFLLSLGFAVLYISCAYKSSCCGP